MFFDEEQSKFEIPSEKEENFGFYTSNMEDYDLSFYEAMYEKIYSRWKYHYILVLSLWFLLSCYYPLFFIIFLFDLLVQWTMLKNIDNFLAQDIEYNMNLHNSQLEGGDLRLDLYIFLCYDSLGYVIYDVPRVGSLICSEVYEYENLMIKQDNLVIYSNFGRTKLKSKNKIISNINSKLKIKSKQINYDCYLLNFKYKKNLKFFKINLLNISNSILDIRQKFNIEKKKNYYIVYNKDYSYSYFDLIKYKKNN